MLAEKLQRGFLTNIDDFSAAIKKDATFKPYGELINSYTMTKGTATFHTRISSSLYERKSATLATSPKPESSRNNVGLVSLKSDLS